jgi:hypothetical protein
MLLKNKKFLTLIKAHFADQASDNRHKLLIAVLECGKAQKRERHLALPLDAQDTSRKLLGFDGREGLHQAAFAASSVILVNNTLQSGFIQAADGDQNGLFRSRGISG